MSSSNEYRTVDRTPPTERPVWQPPRRAGEPADDPAQVGVAIGSGPDALDFSPDGSAAAGIEEVRVDWEPGAAPQARRKGSNTTLLVAAALISICGVGFAAGRVTAEGPNAAAGAGTGSGIAAAQSAAPRPTTGPIIPPAEGFGGTAGGLTPGTTLVTGTVTSVSATSITIQQANGRTVTIAIGPSTTFSRQTPATSAQVVPGATVLVQTAGSGGRERSEGGFEGANPGAATRTATSVTITGN